MSSTFKYPVFLSYSHEDSGVARRLHRRLERFSLPHQLAKTGKFVDSRYRPLAPVFRDRSELSSGSSLSAAIEGALSASQSLVVLCSPAAAASRWVNAEVQAFKRLGKADQIYCFIVDGEPNSGDNHECFPDAVRYQLDKTGVIGTNEAEPLAADARKQGDGFNTASLRLIAGLLGVGFDELRQREQHRRQNRMLVVTAGSLLIAVVTISMAIQAYLSNAEAERRRSEAEDLIGFMLGDLREGLHEIGRLDVFMRVGDKAMEYFSAQADEDADDYLLSQRSKALRQIGSVRLIQGETANALESFRESLAIAERLAARDQESTDRQIALANSHFYIGSVHWQRGELGAARQAFETVISIVDVASNRKPDDPALLMERAYAYTNLGRILELEGNLDLALNIYHDIGEINQHLLNLKPDDTDYQLEVGFSHNNLGKLVESMGQLEQAENHFREDLEIKQRVSQANPAHNLWQQYAASSHVFLARNLILRGNGQESRRHYESALQIVRKLLQIDEENSDWLEMLAIYEQELGALDRREGQFAAAERRIRDSNAIFIKLLLIDQNMSWWQKGLAQGQVEAARLAILRGSPMLALEEVNASLSAFEILLENQPENQETQRLLAAALLTKGDAQDASGDSVSANEAWGGTLTRFDTIFTGSNDPKVQDIHAALLVRTGQQAQAESTVANLQALGYQVGSNL